MLQGAEAALVALVKHFGPSLITKLPRLWERMSSLLLECPADQASSESPSSGYSGRTGVHTHLAHASSALHSQFIHTHHSRARITLSDVWHPGNVCKATAPAHL